MSNRKLLLFLPLILFSCSHKEREVSPQLKPLLEAVYASGFVVSKDESQLMAQAEGYVAEKLVDDGQLVKKGDVLYILESDQQDSRFNLARQNYRIAKQNLSQGSPVLNELYASREATESKLAYDSVNYHRYKNLLEENAVKKSDYDRVRLSYEQVQQEYRSLKSRIAQVQNQLFLEYQNAKSQLAIAGDERGRYVITSQKNGKVFRMFKEKGELVKRTEPVAIIGDDDVFYAQLTVDEKDIERVRTGQTVLMKIDAFPDKVFEGQVEKVYPIIDRQQQSLRVDVGLTDTLPASFSGISLEANIVVRQKEKALVVPKEVLIGKDSLKVKRNDAIQKIRIKRGVETLDEVEVLEGLTLNDVVVY